MNGRWLYEFTQFTYWPFHFGFSVSCVLAKLLVRFASRRFVWCLSAICTNFAPNLFGKIFFLSFSRRFEFSVFILVFVFAEIFFSFRRFSLIFFFYLHVFSVLVPSHCTKGKSTCFNNIFRAYSSFTYLCYYLFAFYVFKKLFQMVIEEFFRIKRKENLCWRFDEYLLPYRLKLFERWVSFLRD
jgi:hypothetical protein